MSDLQAGCFAPILGSLRRQKPKAVKSLDLDKESLPKSVTCASSRHFCGSTKEAHQYPSDKLPPYSAFDEDDIFRPEVMRTIEAEVDALNAELRKLSLQLHCNPEIGFEEVYAHDTLTAFMSCHGFQVTRHYLGLDTAWRAEYSRGCGGRVLGINSEMDALLGMGHACGHNLIAIAGVGVALAVKAALDAHDVDGKIVLLGTPAEEGGGGKIKLLDRGGYDDMDLCIMCHPVAGPEKAVGGGSSLAVQSMAVEYLGHTAHAGATPWEGINALDAAVLAYSGISVLRQQIKPTHRVHGIIEGRDWVPNIIPDYAKMRYSMRAPTVDELNLLRPRVEACFEAGALATGCTYDPVVDIAGTYYELRQNDILMSEFMSTISNRYGFATEGMENALSGASTDFGNVTFKIPGIHPAFSIPTAPNGGNHTLLFTESAKTMEAHDNCLTVVKSLALTGFRAVDDDCFYAQVQSAFTSKNHQCSRY